MTVTTPAGTELLGGYDRPCQQGQEQIGNKTPLGEPETLERWYQVREGEDPG